MFAMDVAIVNVTPFALALLTPTLGKRVQRSFLAWGLSTVLAVLFFILLRHVPTLATTGPISQSLSWVPELGLTLSIYLDGLSLLFSLLVTGIGVVIIIYAGYYIEDLKQLTRFYTLLFLFMGGMLGLILAGNLLMLFICWELTSITSFFLIGFKGSDPEARRGALQALIVTVGGGLALLVGLVLLGSAAQSMEFTAILSNGELLRAHPYYTAAAILIFIGCFAKSAQFPLHFWLPDAMTAPTPASAFLHSATMVKAGIYLLLRFYPVLGDTNLWQVTLTSIGLITMLWGALVALRQKDLKAALAYSTISQLGILVALVGLPEGEGIQAALVGIVAHALYKATLFLVTGIVEHATGTRQLDQLGGVYKQLPGVTGIAVLACLSMAGIPPLLGFVAKEALLDSLLHGPLPVVTVGIVLISAALTVAMAFIIIWDVFFAPKSALEKDHHNHGHHGSADSLHYHPIALSMILGPGMLAVGSLISGLGVQNLIAPLFIPILGEEHVHLALFSGFNPALLISAAAIAIGTAIFVTRNQWRQWSLPALPTGRANYERTVSGVEAVANLVLKSQGGKIRYYLIFIMGSVILLMSTVGLEHIAGQSIQISLSSSADVLKLVLLVLSLIATFASVIFRNHLVAALALGVAGYSIGGIFLLEPAPDVALVQFLVETIGTVLIITMLGKIRSQERLAVAQSLWERTPRGMVRDIVISVLVAIGVGLFSLAAVINRPSRETIATWHMDHSLPDVGATDMVAAIVTDFRGMDTVIEITVFGMAALGVLTLLSTPEAGQTWQFSVSRMLQQMRSRGFISQNPVYAADKEAIDPVLQQEAAALRPVPKMLTPLTRRIALLVLPFSFLIGLSHILYSGVAPGDGFTAGVVGGLGVALWYVVLGYDEAKRRLRWMHPTQLIGVGFGLAILNAFLPLLFGKPFLMTTLLDQIHLPANIHLSSTMLFEIGICLAVLGGSSVILETIAHPGEVETL
jgi:NADH:ubiquinone oxidoreductase subunit 5 (subunit L)/multisubunit Na+/H+ antiporter MnhA subunit